MPIYLFFIKNQTKRQIFKSLNQSDLFTNKISNTPIRMSIQSTLQQQTNKQTNQTTKSSLIKPLDFYTRAKRQYQNAAQPFTYEFNIYSTQPKPKKFMIILNKFIDIFKEGMKWEFRDDDQTKDNYWNELQKYYSSLHYEMAFISDNSYEKKKNKLRLYFGLLLANKKLFEVLEDIPVRIPDLYEDPTKKIQQLDQQLQPVSFLRDGRYLILSDTVGQFQKFYEERKREQKIKQKQADAQKKKQEQLQKAKKKKQQQQKLEKEQKAQQQRQRLQRQRKQEQLKQKQKEEQKLKASDKNDPSEKTPTPPILDDSIGFIPDTYRTQYVHDKTNQLMRRRYQNKQAIQDLPGNQITKGKHQKNSQILFEDKYKDQFEVFSFRLKPEMQTPEQKKQVCSECNKPLKQGFYFIGGNQNQCYYTGQWFCNEHMAEERIAIPWKALQSFDLRGYPVSRKSYIEIKSYYEKPIIEIKSESSVVKHSKPLYDFLVLKRQIHLMYDSICDLQLMEPLLKKKLNYCLKQNLFSLKNLYDIYNGHESSSLQKEYDVLSKHFYRCQRCQKRKGYICPKCKDPVKIFAFQLKETHGCTHCRKLYHRKCLTGGKCDCQEDD